MSLHWRTAPSKDKTLLPQSVRLKKRTHGRHATFAKRAQASLEISGARNTRQTVLVHEHSRLVFPHRRAQGDAVRGREVPRENSLSERIPVQTTRDYHVDAVGKIRAG